MARSLGMAGRRRPCRAAAVRATVRLVVARWRSRCKRMNRTKCVSDVLSRSDRSGSEGGSQRRAQGGSSPHPQGRQQVDDFANHPANEAVDEFRSRKLLVLQRRAGHPAPRRSRRDRRRGCPRPLPPDDWMEGSEAASKLGSNGGGWGGELGEGSWERKKIRKWGSGKGRGD